MKKFILISILSAFIINLNAQDDGFYESSEDEKDNKASKKEIRQQKLEKWAFGGNFWLSFGTNSYVEVSPIAVYKPTPRLMLGPGFTFIYEKNSYWGYETVIYGPKVMANYALFTNLNELLNINVGHIVAHTEYELLNIERIYQSGQPGKVLKDGRIWVNTLLVGGGIYQPFGGRGGMSLIILFDVLENDFSPYSNPIFRLGFFF